MREVSTVQDWQAQPTDFPLFNFTSPTTHLGTACVAHNAAGGNGVIAIATCARVNADLLVYESRVEHSAEDLICPQDYFATRCYVRTAWILTR